MHSQVQLKLNSKSTINSVKSKTNQIIDRTLLGANCMRPELIKFKISKELAFCKRN